MDQLPKLSKKNRTNLFKLFQVLGPRRRCMLKNTRLHLFLCTVLVLLQGTSKFSCLCYKGPLGRSGEKFQFCGMLRYQSDQLMSLRIQKAHMCRIISKNTIFKTQSCSTPAALAYWSYCLVLPKVCFQNQNCNKDSPFFLHRCSNFLLWSGSMQCPLQAPVV